MFKNSFFLSLGALAAMSCSGFAAADGEVSDQAALILQEIQQMRTDYEARIKQMEIRIAELEQTQTSKAEPKVAVSKPAPIKKSAPAVTSSQSDDSKGGLVKTEVIAPEGFEFDSLVKGFTFEGYFLRGMG